LERKQPQISASAYSVFKDQQALVLKKAQENWGDFPFRGGKTATFGNMWIARLCRQKPRSGSIAQSNFPFPREFATVDHHFSSAPQMEC
jgi:hypothetical protein